MLAKVKAAKTAVTTILTAQFPRIGAWTSYNKVISSNKQKINKQLVSHFVLKNRENSKFFEQIIKLLILNILTHKK